MATPRLSELVIKYKRRANLSFVQVGKKSDLPSKTIQSWAKEYSKHPRRWQDLVQFADAVALNLLEVDELLQTAGHPPVEDLQRRGEDLHLLKRWEQRKPVYQIPRMAAANFRGREADQAKIESRLFSGEKLCVIQGMGGIGKSSLAICMAQKLHHKFPDGLLWADLRIMGPVEILNSWAHALGVELPASQNVKALSACMSGILSRKVVLIILDDIVNINDARLLLPAFQTPCSILATTRSKEVANALVTDPENLISLAPMHPETSVQLVKDVLGPEVIRTRRATVHEICDLLGHLPLALNIFSRRQRISLVPVEQSLAKLKDIKTRLDSLKLGDEAVRTAFEQSWEQLTPPLQGAFKAMAVFGGRSFRIDDFSEIAGQPPSKARELVDQLQYLFLVEQADTADERFIQHPLLASWANELLEETSLLWLAVAKHYFAFAGKYRNSQTDLMRDWQNIMAGMSEAHRLEEWQLVLDYMNCLQSIWTEQGQYQSAMQGFAWASVAAEKLERPDQLSFIYLHWGIACIAITHYEEAREKLQLALQYSESQALVDTKGDIHFHISRICTQQDNYAEGYQELQTAWRYYQETENVLGMANALWEMGDLEYYKGNYPNALSLGEDALKLHVELDNVVGQMQTLMLIATAAQMLNDLEMSEAYILRAEGILGRVPEKSKQAGFYYSRANLSRLQHEFDRAYSYANKSLVLWRGIGKLFDESNVLNLIALIEVDWSEKEPDPERSLQAIEHATQSRDLCDQIRNELGKAYAILTLGKGLRQTGNLHEACNQWNEALSISKRLQNDPLTHWLEELLAGMS